MGRPWHENDKVKSSLGLILHYTMEMYWGVKVWSHTSSFLAIDGGGIFTMNG
jgi:hypothetical protein